MIFSGVRFKLTIDRKKTNNKKIKTTKTHTCYLHITVANLLIMQGKW